MTEVSSLLGRIQQEFAESQKKLKQFQEKQIVQHQEREQRLAKLEQIFNQLRNVWGPRLECLAQEFGDRVNIKPIVTPGLRCASMEFNSPLAQIVLQFSAGTDSDVTKLVLACDLDILPILMTFDKHTEIAFPLDQIDPVAVGQWLDDQIVGFVKTYLSLHENEYYLKGHMVDDPIAHVRFPKFAAGATRQQNGKTVYFISEETAQSFDKQSK
jgi:YHS domain-containing protein